MRVAVIGGGIVGVSTAYFLASAGHEVVVIESGSNVAEEASFAHSGLIAPALATPWAMPGMPRQLLSMLFHGPAPLLVRHRLDPALWRWARRWIAECELSRFRINKERLQRIGAYSRELLQQLREHYHLEFEQTTGHLQLFRTERELGLARPGLAVLAESSLPHQLLDAEAARLIEPALNPATPLLRALHLPDDDAGNCALFSKQLKLIAQQMGVGFRFNTTIDRVERVGQQIALHCTNDSFAADGVILAAGNGNLPLLKALGINVPFLPVQGYSATCTIRDFDEAPLASVSDDTFKTTITRFGNRIRINGVAEPCARQAEVPEAAQRTLQHVGMDWFPNATNYHNATLWSNVQAMLPDGVPLLGQTSLRNVLVGMDDGANGWTSALGIGKILSDLLSDQHPDIDIDGLTLSRYG